MFFLPPFQLQDDTNGIAKDNAAEDGLEDGDHCAGLFAPERGLRGEGDVGVLMNERWRDP